MTVIDSFNLCLPIQQSSTAPLKRELAPFPIIQTANTWDSWVFINTLQYVDVLVSGLRGLKFKREKHFFVVTKKSFTREGK